MTTDAPGRGDVCWVSLNPALGHEQAGRRPALVISPAAYNELVELAVVCPITNQGKGYPFEVAIPAGLPVTGVILADHVRSIAWPQRNAELICHLPEAVTAQVIGLLRRLLE